MSAAPVTLDDKYALQKGRIYLTGAQALVRLPIAQRQRDRAAGRNTGGFISGYRGSPLGGYDQALWRAQPSLQAQDIHFSPGVNEDLAATAVWGSQQTRLFPGARVDGVIGVWCGKGHGVDRSIDVFKHANAAGVDPNGGVLAIVGDDHGCQSSILAHQSEQVLIAAMVPLLNPATGQEYIDVGLLGFALSRFAGCWLGFKAATETVESSASITIDPAGFVIHTPQDFTPPPGGPGIRWPDPPLELEGRLHGLKMRAIAAFARANRLDWPVWSAPNGLRPRPRLTGELRKQTFGLWMLGVFGLLAHGKAPRGTWADPFGRSLERRAERRRVAEYEQLIDHLCERLGPHNHAQAIALAQWPQTLRGYGHVKAESLAAAQALSDMRAAFDAAAAAGAIAA